MRTIFIFLLFQIIIYSSIAQISIQNGKIIPEVETDQSHVFPLGERGVLTIYRTNAFEGKPEWKMVHYDENMKLLKDTVMGFHKKTSYRAHALDQGILYIFYQRPMSTESFILRYDPVIKKLSLQNIYMAGSILPEQMEVAGNYAYINGYSGSGSTYKLELFRIDLTTKKMESLLNNTPGYKADKIKLQKTNKGNVVVVSTVKRKELYPLTLYRIYSAAGNLKFAERDVKLESTARFASGLQLLEEDDSTYVIIGNYMTSVNSWSHGLYFTRIRGSKILNYDELSYDNFANFYNHLPSHERDFEFEKRMKRRKEGYIDHCDVKMVEHPILQNDSGFVFIGECYIPTFEYTDHSLPIGNIDIDWTSESFSGYRYEYYLVAAFTKDGKLRWEQTAACSFHEKEMKLKNISVAFIDRENIKIVQPGKDELSAYTLNENGIISIHHEPSGIDEKMPENRGVYPFASKIDYLSNTYVLFSGIKKIIPKGYMSTGEPVFYFYRYLIF